MHPSNGSQALSDLERMLPAQLQALLADILILGGKREEVEPLLLGYLAGHEPSVDWKNAPDYERLATMAADPEGVEWLEEKLEHLKARLERRRRLRRIAVWPLRPLFTPRVVRFVKRHAAAERQRRSDTKKRDGGRR